MQSIKIKDIKKIADEKQRQAIELTDKMLDMFLENATITSR